MQTTIRNSLVAIRRNPAGKVYMLHFSYADVPAYKIIDYLTNLNTVCEVSYHPGIGLSFGAHRILELNSYGRPISEFTIDNIADKFIASKEECKGIVPEVMFAQNADQTMPLTLKHPSEFAEADYMTLAYNFRQMIDVEELKSKSIIVLEDVVTSNPPCKITAKSAPELYTIRLQGTCDIDIASAPKLNSVVLTQGDIWVPSNDDAHIRQFTHPSSDITLGNLRNCTFEINYLAGYRGTRGAPENFFDGYNIAINNSQGIVINSSECINSLIIQDSSNIQVNLSNGAKIKYLEFKNCSNIQVSVPEILDKCILNNTDNANIQANIEILKFVGSSGNYRGKAGSISLSAKSQLNLHPGTEVTNIIECATHNIINADKTVKVPLIIYDNLSQKALINADVIMLSYKDSREGTQAVYINRIPKFNRLLKVFNDYPHILYIAPNISATDALNSIFAPIDKCTFSVDADYENTPNAYIICSPGAKDKLTQLYGRLMRGTKSKAIFYSQDDGYTDIKAWLSASGVTYYPAVLPF